MNRTISLAAIAMFAVIMGMSAFTPAMAVPKGNSGAAQTAVCHYFAVYLDVEETELDEEASAWGVLFINSKAIPGHTTEEEGHVDDVFLGDIEDEEAFNAWKQTCLDQNL